MMSRKDAERWHRHIFRSHLARQAKRLRPVFEPLENRQLPSTVDWINPNRGS